MTQETNSGRKINRRDFFKWAALGVGGATAGVTLEWFCEHFYDSPAPEVVVKSITETLTPKVVPTLTLVPLQKFNETITPQPSQIVTVPEVTKPVEKPKVDEFKIGDVKLDIPFSIIVPGDISGDLGFTKGLEVGITMPLINRDKIGWPDAIVIPFEQYWKNPGAALIAQSDIPGHDVVILHSFNYAGILLPGEVFRRVKDREGLIGKEFQLKQSKEVNSRLQIVDVTQVTGDIFESSDAQPTNTTDLEKFVFFRSDMWKLNAGDDARQPGQITFVTCDGRYVKDNINKFATRLLITAELFPERPGENVVSSNN
jgi:hypothetical protein